LRSFLFQLFSSIPNTQYEKIVLIYARDGRGAIEICLLEKRALAKKKIGKHCSSAICSRVMAGHNFKRHDRALCRPTL